MSPTVGLIQIIKIGSAAFAEKSDLVNWPLWPLAGTYEYNL